MSESLERVFFLWVIITFECCFEKKAGAVSYSCQFKITIFHSIMTHILPALWHLFFFGHWFMNSWSDHKTSFFSHPMNVNLLSFFFFDIIVVWDESFQNFWGGACLRREWIFHEKKKDLTGGFNMKIYRVLWCMSKYCRNKSRRAITWMLFFALLNYVRIFAFRLFFRVDWIYCALS